MEKNNTKKILDSHKMRDEKLKQDEKRFRSLFENANDAIWLVYKNTFIDCNLKTLKIFGCDKKEDMVGHTPMDFSPAKQPDGQDSKKKALRYLSAASKGHPQKFYWKHKKKDGTLIDTEISLNKIVLSGKTYIQALGRDITENKKEEISLLRVNRALRMVSEINQALIHASDEKELLNKICQIAVDVGGYRSVWVGFIEHNKFKTLRPVAQAGYELGHLEKTKLNSENIKYGCNLEKIVIRTKKINVSQNISIDPRMAPGEAGASKRGYGSAIALPLGNKEIFGVISACAQEINVFSDEEVKILEELAKDLSFGILTLRIRAKNKFMEDIIRKNEIALKEAERIGNFGSFDWDARTDTIVWSDEYYRIYGFNPKLKPPGYEEHLKVYSSESAARLDAAVKKSMKTGKPYVLDLEQVRPDGTRKWVTARGEVKRDKNNKIIGC